ncbi:helix-turn-helix domain-containing protein [Mesorhizobium sp. SP-1A]|uniref:helix-turn-helix domain-containing protein n=1 Tax=Mesorhizobium sp. SP-1A TaxID=3077840 RepID=UPI0028F72759|nr:helix-turn-helix domain-containing protein [Mesorhizobium sp. SP-1A]
MTAVNAPVASSRSFGTPWRDRPFLSIAFAADLLGVSRAFLYRMEKEGRLRFGRLAGKTLVKTDSLLHLIDNVEDWRPSERGAAGRAARTALVRPERAASEHLS